MRKFYRDCLVWPFIIHWILACGYCLYVNIHNDSPFDWSGLARAFIVLMGICFVWTSLVALSLLPVLLLGNEVWRDSLLTRYLCWWGLPITGGLLLAGAIYRSIGSGMYRFYADDLLLLAVLFLPYSVGIWLSWRNFNKAYPR